MATIHGVDIARPEYQNWVKASLILQQLKAGIEGFVDGAMHEVHGNILAAVRRELGITELSCGSCDTSKLRNPRYVCPSGICSLILQKIQGIHGYGKANLRNTDVRLWLDTNASWEIAKCLLHDVFPYTSSAAETELIGLLGLLLNCRALHHLMSMDTINILSEVRVIRNVVMHSHNQCIETKLLENLVQMSLAILKDAKSLGDLPAAKMAAANINQTAGDVLHMRLDSLRSQTLTPPEGNRPEVSVIYQRQDNPPPTEDVGNVEVVADLRLNKDAILYEGPATTVYEGYFEGTVPVAVKKIYLAAQTQSENVNEYLRILREVDNAREVVEHNHPNIVRFFKSERKENFLYIAFELCQGTVEDYVDDRANWREVLPWKTVVRQMNNGIRFLHETCSPSIVHRDLKPSNVLLVQSQTITKVVIADFGQSKMLNSFQCSLSGQTGSLGWIAKEATGSRQSGNRYHKASDIFPLGCLIYYVVTGGKHPFGPEDDPITRQANISNGMFDVSGLLPHLDCLKQLIQSMIASNHEERPLTDSVAKHPSLLADTSIIKFMHEASNRIQSYPTQAQQPTLAQQHTQDVLEDPSIIPGGNWMQLLPANTRRYLSTFKLPNRHTPMFRGKETIVRDLLRAVRNCREHYLKLDAAVKAEIGPSDSDHLVFWLTLFPWLLMHVHNRMSGDQELIALMASFDV